VQEESQPNDIDIAVIFQKVLLKEQLIEAQKIKRQLEKQEDLPIHIKAFDFYTLFDKANFAQEGILFYGKSLISQKNFAEQLNLIPKVQISYNLEHLVKKEKIKFNYLLQGKNKKYGILRKCNGKLIRPGLIEINPEWEKLIIIAIKEQIDSFKIRKIFLSEFK
jgi:hypothetical protein